jgi:hypothetical protein
VVVVVRGGERWSWQWMALGPKQARAGQVQGRGRHEAEHELGRATINIGCVTWRRERAQARALQAAQSTAGKTTRQMQHARCNTQDATRKTQGARRTAGSG